MDILSEAMGSSEFHRMRTAGHSMTVSEEDSEAHICEIHVVEINELPCAEVERREACRILGFLTCKK